MNDKFKPILAGWEGYREMVVPKDAGPVQIAECKQAFFGGAAILFFSLMRMGDHGDLMPDEEAEHAFMLAVESELMSYGMQLDADFIGKTRPDIKPH